MEQNNNQPVDDFSLNIFSVTPPQSNRPDQQVTDGDKAGATLLFSGLFLGLVGITFTVMGWINREASSSFEWTQLLGPILLSVGVTFALISVCRFKMLSCKSCKSSEEVTPDGEQPPSRPSFVFTGINQPITFHGATVLQYIPPPYTAQDVSAISATSSSLPNPNPSMGNGSTLPMSPPKYYSIYPMDNLTFVGDDPVLAPPPTVDGYERRTDDTAQPENFQETTIPSDPPPLYKDIFPEIQ